MGQSSGSSRRPSHGGGGSGGGGARRRHSRLSMVARVHLPRSPGENQWQGAGQKGGGESGWQWWWRRVAVAAAAAAAVAGVVETRGGGGGGSLEGLGLRPPRNHRRRPPKQSCLRCSNGEVRVARRPPRARLSHAAELAPSAPWRRPTSRPLRRPAVQLFGRLAFASICHGAEHDLFRSDVGGRCWRLARAAVAHALVSIVVYCCSRQ